MPKWLSRFDIGNSKMVILHLLVKFKCLAHLTTSRPGAFPNVKPHRPPFSAALPLGSKRTKLPMVFTCTRLCSSSLSSWCSFWVDCPSLSSSPSNSYLALRLVVGAVSSKPQAGGLISALWTSPCPNSSTLPLQHDRDIVLFIFVPTQPSTVPGTEQALRKYLLH